MQCPGTACVITTAFFNFTIVFLNPIFVSPQSYDIVIYHMILFSIFVYFKDSESEEEYEKSSKSKKRARSPSTESESMSDGGRSWLVLL